MILIADNSPLNRMQIAGILSPEYEILEADDGRAALEVMRKKGADKLACVLLDLHMPGFTGYDFLAEKAADPAIADIPVVIITADSVTNAEVKALDLGASDFLTKPIEPEIVRRRIRSVVTARELEEQRLRIRTLEEVAWHSDHDDLTGIYTRKAFLREANKLLLDNPDISYFLVFFDFEKFKMLNELFGSKAGDEALKTTANTLSELLHGHGVYCRLNNDRFAFCIPDMFMYVEDILDRIIDAVTAKLKSMNIGFVPVLAAGAYPVEDRDSDMGLMLDRAVIAQGMVKGDYDRHVGFYNAELSNHLYEEQEILNNMEAALEAGEFRVQLQPVYDVNTGEPASAEALVRWHRPGHGIVSPGLFIPLFEENGFITKMDQSIWEQVCQIQASRRDRGLPEIPISVNLSRRSIYSDSIFESIVGVVEKYGIKPNLFRIEVTESSYAEDTERIISIVKRLQEYGFTILMDDFGSGYSTLTSLKDIPVDILKADMMFMRDFESGGRIGSIFTSVVRMARWLGIPVIAEGVETAEQVEFLRSVGCRYSQGYYFARPMPVEEFEQHLVDHPVRTLSSKETSFSKEDIDELMGGSRILERVMENVLEGFAIFEWNNGDPEMIRSSEGFREALSLKSYPLSLERSYAHGLLDEEALAIFKEACEETIKTREGADFTIAYRNTEGVRSQLTFTIVCINAIEKDAMFFVALRKSA